LSYRPARLHRLAESIPELFKRLHRAQGRQTQDIKCLDGQELAYLSLFVLGEI